MLVLALLLTVQQQTQQDTSNSGLPPSPVASITVSPATPTVTVGDSLRLHAQPVDASGKPVSGAQVRWFGGSFEGHVDSTGMLHAGAPGRFRVRMVATVSGARPSKPGSVLVVMTLPPPTRVVVSPSVSRLMTGQRMTLQATTFTATGDRRMGDVRWHSSAPRIVSVTNDGHLVAAGVGRATVTATAGPASASVPLTVVANTVRRIEITHAGADNIRTGDVVRFQAVAHDAAGAVVSGATPVWSMSPGQGIIDQDGSFVAYEAGVYTVTASVGAATADVGMTVRHRDVRRAATTLGRQPIAGVLTAEFWPHPNGRNAYLTTIADKVYALDISDPTNPRITDSIVVDARIINDLMTTADGKYGVIPREGASSRRNGIVILSFEDPAHPKPIAEYTATVTGGVHSTYVYTQPQYGTHVYLTDDATGSMRVIDLNDPMHPKEVARWQTPRSDAGRYLHDIDIHDGLAYLSYWNDGLVILDVGNGIKGGSPTNPQFVSQFTYDLNDLYRNVEAEGGPGYIRGTHTSWRRRDGKYVFVGDEVFSTKPQGILIPGDPLGKANGRLHVVDVSDIMHPHEVAYFEPSDGGSHNVWVAGDTLYLGDYQGGLRVLDISGDLKGDLLAEDREIAHVHTGDAKGFVPNAAMAWGAFYVNGTVWVNDVFSGLWAVRIEPKETTPQPAPVQ
jgi:hypothetical protein